MQIHNTLSPARRAGAIDALELVVTNLPKCRAGSGSSEDQLLFVLENREAGIETLRLRLRKDEMRVFIAVRRGARVHTTSFAEHLCGPPSTRPWTLGQAVPRLSEWRRYLNDVSSDDAVHALEAKRSTIIKAAVGAATMLDDRWKTIDVLPAFDTKPPAVLLRGLSGRKSFFPASGAEDGPFGTMSDELVRELSILSEYLCVTAWKNTSNSGVEIEFGPLPSIAIINDLSTMDLLRAIRHAEVLGFRMLP